MLATMIMADRAGAASIAFLAMGGTSPYNRSQAFVNAHPITKKATATRM